MAATVITRSRFRSLLAAPSGATIIGLTVRGSAPARFARHKGRITKTSYFSTMLNARYDKLKAKALGVDVDSLDPPKPVAWKEQIPNTPLSRHKSKGTEYIEAYYLSGHAAYTLDGEDVEQSAVADMLKPAKKGDITWITPKLENVIGARIAGTEYVVIDD